MLPWAPWRKGWIKMHVINEIGCWDILVTQLATHPLLNKCMLVLHFSLLHSRVDYQLVQLKKKNRRDHGQRVFGPTALECFLFTKGILGIFDVLIIKRIYTPPFWEEVSLAPLTE